MTPYEVIGWSLLNTTAVTAIVGTSTSRTVTHGLRPRNSDVPCINYFELGGGSRFSGYERQPYSINCRAATPAAAMDLARVVTTVFAGSAGTGIYGRLNGFNIERGSLIQKQGLIPEDKVDGVSIYNAPVDITIVYPSSTVS